MKIKKIHAREILDSRGNPTLEVEVTLLDGSIGVAKIPSGASTGEDEALELRDGDKDRYLGKGMLKACENVNIEIAKALRGEDASNQEKIDKIMLDLDGTENKRNLGANAILGVSLACAYAQAHSKRIPLYKYLRGIFGLSSNEYILPLPLVNVFNGGKHADTNLDIQEFKIIPKGCRRFCEAIRACSETFHLLGEVLRGKGLDSDVGNEGGYSPNVETNFQAFEFISEAIEKAGYTPGEDIALGIDAAASEFYDEKDALYVLGAENTSLDKDRLLSLYAEWIPKYKLVSIEDGLEQKDLSGWKDMTQRLGDQVQLIGDDFFVTSPEKIKKGIEEGAANAVLIKPNQIGTLTETLLAIRITQKAKYNTIISHRSGETSDTFIADLAVAVNSGQIKTGSVSRGERTVKYNRLLKIEEELGKKAKFKPPL